MARATWPDAPLARAEATALPFPDASFDRVAALGVLGYLSVSDLAGALAECHRVLRPGGVLVICTGRRLNALAGLARAALQTLRGRPGGVRSHVHPAGAYRGELERLGFAVEDWIDRDQSALSAPRWFRAVKG